MTNATDTMKLPAPKPPTTKRILELDSLRAIAALNLVLFHFTHVYSVKYGYTSDLGFEWSYGKYGVQLFFMLSGFVNAMTLMKKRQPADFLAGRIVRICPSFWSVIILNCLIVGLAPLTAIAWSSDQIAANLTIMPNLLGYTCMEPVTWTLQVEILFYGLLLLMFVSGALATPLRTVFFLLSLSAVTCGCIQYLHTLSHAPSWLLGLEQFRELMILEYLPLFTMGILLNEIKNKRGSWWGNAIGILASAIVFHAIDRHHHNPAATLILFTLLAMSAYGRVPVLRFRPLVFISSISYALYLLHNNLGCVFIYHLNQAGISPLMSMIAGILFVIAVSAFITIYVEQPVTKYLRDSWFRLKARWANRNQVVTVEPS